MFRASDADRARMGFRRALYLCLFFLTSALAWAECPQYFARLAKDIPRVEIGQLVQFAEAHRPPRPGIFLGRLVDVDGSSKLVGIYEPRKNVIHYIPEEKFHLDRPAGPVRKEELTPIVRNVAQVGPTCAAFSTFHCLREIHLRGGANPGGPLPRALASESERMRLLTTAVNQQWNYSGVALRDLNNVVNEYGMEAEKVSGFTKKALRTNIDQHLAEGRPVMLDYDITQEMMRPDYKIFLEGAELEKLRLWLPYRRPANWLSRLGLQRRRPGGRHRIVLLAQFTHGGKKRYLVSDPNWELPRIWDGSEFEETDANMVAFVLKDRPAKP
jgi:hypothetical protein